MLIPRFSIRALLIATTFCAVIASTFSWALAGAAWAAGLASVVVLLAVAFCLYLLLFSVAFGFAQLVSKRNQGG